MTRKYQVFFFFGNDFVRMYLLKQTNKQTNPHNLMKLQNGRNFFSKLFPSFMFFLLVIALDFS